MAEILDKVRDVAEGQIDFEGQRLSEFLLTVLLSAVGGVSFGAGYLLQDIKLALFLALGGSVLVFLVIVPAWPVFNRHPVRRRAVESSTIPMLPDQKIDLGNLTLG